MRGNQPQNVHGVYFIFWLPFFLYYSLCFQSWVRLKNEAFPEFSTDRLGEKKKEKNVKSKVLYSILLPNLVLLIVLRSVNAVLYCTVEYCFYNNINTVLNTVTVQGVRYPSILVILLE